MIAIYQQRLVARGAAAKGIAAYLYQLRVILRVAKHLAGHAVALEGLIAEPHLLGRTLIFDHSLATGACLARWTLSQRRSALRSFATLMRPELVSWLGDDPHSRLDSALRLVAERVGAGYRLSGGKPRRRGGAAPTGDEISALLEAAAKLPDYRGLRDHAFFRILAETGMRVNALRMVDGADCVEIPSGHLRLFVHEKGKREPREIELSAAAAACLRLYARAFNRLAISHGWQARIQIGKAGAVWRNSGRGRWPYADISKALRAACLEAGISPFTPHALRRAFASDAARELPRHIVAQAGGWHGLGRLDDHYIHPRADALWRKLAAAQRIGSATSQQEEIDRASTPAI